MDYTSKHITDKQLKEIRYVTKNDSLSKADVANALNNAENINILPYTVHRKDIGLAPSLKLILAGDKNNKFNREEKATRKFSKMEKKLKKKNVRKLLVQIYKDYQTEMIKVRGKLSF